MNEQSAAARLQSFLSVAAEFHLGDLPTEQPHPLTSELSQLSARDPGRALALLHRIDCDALAVLPRAVDRIADLAHAIAATLTSGHQVFLCGCGATGRLALTCEVLWRQAHRCDCLGERVHGFIAGGDIALVKSLENVEDHPEYGERHLRELRFGDHDLLIALTEGGETPFVIGATLAAASLSRNRPFFLYCNPDEILRRVAERARDVTDDNRIEKINLTVGPMALAGSTRMQAATVLMAAAGAALQCHANPERIPELFAALHSYWGRCDPSFLSGFAAAESAVYKDNGRVVYAADPDLAISVLSDTTERSPTFSMPPFENRLDDDAALSPCYLAIPGAGTSREAWEMILGRPPAGLEWPEMNGRASSERLLGFDFGRDYQSARSARCAPAVPRTFSIVNNGDAIAFAFEHCAHTLDTNGLPPLWRHLVLKMLLNMHSTTVMGRLDRYDGNIMTWVKPSNNKLIDRAIRYADLLLRRHGAAVPYERIAQVLFDTIDTCPADRSIVHEVVARLGRE